MNKIEKSTYLVDTDCHV